MNPEDIVVSFMNPRTREAFTDLPDEAVVITPLVPEGMVWVVREAEFLQWLEEGKINV